MRPWPTGYKSASISRGSNRGGRTQERTFGEKKTAAINIRRVKEAGQCGEIFFLTHCFCCFNLKCIQFVLSKAKTDLKKHNQIIYHIRQKKNGVT